MRIVSRKTDNSPQGGPPRNRADAVAAGILQTVYTGVATYGSHSSQGPVQE